MSIGHILLIDDDMRFLELMQDIFEIHNYTLTLYNGQGRLPTFIGVSQPNVVIVGYCLNGLNIGEVCRMLVNDPQMSSTPIVLMASPTEAQASMNVIFSD